MESNLGQLHFRLGDNESARNHYARAAELYHKTGSEQGLGHVENNLGELHFRLGDNAAAQQHYARAEELYLKTGDEQGLGHIHHLWAAAERQEERFTQAYRCWLEALACYSA